MTPTEVQDCIDAGRGGLLTDEEREATISPAGAQPQNPLELLRCVQVNLGNLVAMSPAVARHPMYLIARAQLDGAVAALEERAP